MRKTLLTLLTATGVLCAGTIHAQNLPIPAEWQGFYAGTQKGKNHRLVPPSSFQENVNLILNENTCQMSVQSDGGGAALSGTAMSNGVLVFYRADVPNSTLGVAGRLKAAGKPGKMKLTGVATLIIDEYPLLADVKVKLKQLPIIP